MDRALEHEANPLGQRHGEELVDRHRPLDATLADDDAIRWRAGPPHVEKPTG